MSHNFTPHYLSYLELQIQKHAMLGKTSPSGRLHGRKSLCYHTDPWTNVEIEIYPIKSIGIAPIYPLLSED